MSTRVIIIAAGEATRWNNYLGTKKHLIGFGASKERLIDRTARLFSENGIKDIRLVAKKEDIEEYTTPHSKTEVANLNPKNYDADKFLSSRHLWLDGDEDRTIIVYGDCYFTENAVRIIVETDRKDFMLFGRAFTSNLTRNGGECFAFSFYGQDIEGLDNDLKQLIKLYNAEEIDRIGGWEWYRIHVGVPLNRHFVGDNFKNIDDFTDDFDKPENYDNFKYAYDQVFNTPL